MAGTLKANQIQLGDSSTAANNLVLRTNQDGTFTIARGNVGATTDDLLTIDANGNVFLPSGRYISPAQTITSSGALTLTHGLGVTPRNVMAYIKCTVAEGGYSVGDELVVSTNCVSNSSTDSQGFSLVVDATALNIRFGATANIFRSVNKSTGASLALTNANWQLYLIAEM